MQRFNLRRKYGNAGPLVMKPEDDGKWVEAQVSEAEQAMLAWESNLPDLPAKQEVLLIEGRLSDIAFERIKAFVERRVMGGSKAQEVLVIEGDNASWKFVDEIRTSDDAT